MNKGTQTTDKPKPRPEITHTAIVHPPVPPRGKKGGRVTGILR
ncbi:hypothetical protein [Anaerospora hongkongensis]|nr:hypothetical protein [Anaerospora hongkongensis]